MKKLSKREVTLGELVNSQYGRVTLSVAAEYLPESIATFTMSAYTPAKVDEKLLDAVWQLYDTWLENGHDSRGSTAITVGGHRLRMRFTVGPEWERTTRYIQAASVHTCLAAVAAQLRALKMRYLKAPVEIEPPLVECHDDVEVPQKATGEHERLWAELVGSMWFELLCGPLPRKYDTDAPGQRFQCTD